jgi:hypothetical protein
MATYLINQKFSALSEATRNNYYNYFIGEITTDELIKKYKAAKVAEAQKLMGNPIQFH